MTDLCIHYSLAGRRHLALTNIRVCFPQLSHTQHRRLVRAHFRVFVQAALATPISWWGSEQRMKRLVRTPGKEHFDKALVEKKPVILLVAHFVSIEVAGMVLAPVCRLSGGSPRTGLTVSGESEDFLAVRPESSKISWR